MLIYDLQRPHSNICEGSKQFGRCCGIPGAGGERQGPVGRAVQVHSLVQFFILVHYFGDTVQVLKDTDQLAEQYKCLYKISCMHNAHEGQMGIDILCIGKAKRA